MSLQEIIQYILDVLGRGSQRVDQKRLVGCLAIACYRGFHGEQLIRFDIRQQPEADGGQRFAGQWRIICILKDVVVVVIEMFTKNMQRSLESY